MVQTLNLIPSFPSRLKADLNEAQAWYFYKQQAWDSAAVYLEKALDNAANKQETARWEYLIAQMYEATSKHDLAKEFYDRVIKHTINPVMEVYAVLNSIRQGEGPDEKTIQNAVDALKKMGRRDKYVIYRDIIYYTAAQIELDRKQNKAAKLFLEKSIRYSLENPPQKSRSFLALANINFAERNYIDARRFYDSTDVAIIAPEDLDALR